MDLNKISQGSGKDGLNDAIRLAQAVNDGILKGNFFVECVSDTFTEHGSSYTGITLHLSVDREHYNKLKKVFE